MIIQQVRKVLRPGKYATFILANNRIGGEQIPLSEIVNELMALNNLTNIVIQERLIKVNRRRYPYGITGFDGLLESEYIIHAKRV